MLSWSVNINYTSCAGTHLIRKFKLLRLHVKRLTVPSVLQHTYAAPEASITINYPQNAVMRGGNNNNSSAALINETKHTLLRGH
jgi:hypothetical protein